MLSTLASQGGCKMAICICNNYVCMFFPVYVAIMPSLLVQQIVRPSPTCQCSASASGRANGRAAAAQLLHWQSSSIEPEAVCRHAARSAMALIRPRDTRGSTIAVQPLPEHMVTKMRSPSDMPPALTWIGSWLMMRCVFQSEVGSCVARIEMCCPGFLGLLAGGRWKKMWPAFVCAFNVDDRELVSCCLLRDTCLQICHFHLLKLHTKSCNPAQNNQGSPARVPVRAAKSLLKRCTTLQNAEMLPTEH